MVENKNTMSGAERAAVLLLSLGEDAAASVLKHLDPREVQHVGEAMTKISAISNDKLTEVVGDFTTMVGQTAIGLGTTNFVKRILTQALGENKGQSMISRILQGAESKGMDALKWMDARSVSSILKDEHPQICAIVLSSLDSEHGAEVLTLLPEKRRPEILMRVASLDAIHPNALEELDEMLAKQITENISTPPSKVDGLRSAANILNYVDVTLETELIDSIREENREMGEVIREMMFVFDNLIQLDDRGMQRLLREITGDSLVVALKGADEALQQKIFNNMSKRAAEMLEEDLEAKGPVRLSEVEIAQKEILNTASRLSEEGEISLGKKAGDDFV